MKKLILKFAAITSLVISMPVFAAGSFHIGNENIANSPSLNGNKTALLVIKTKRDEIAVGFLAAVKSPMFISSGERALFTLKVNGKDVKMMDVGCRDKYCTFTPSTIDGQKYIIDMAAGNHNIVDRKSTRLNSSH